MENKKSFQRSVVIAEAKKIIGLKTMAYKDYIAARNLLQSGFLHQGAFFANTCIEKELKAYLFTADINVNTTHETPKLLNLISRLEHVNWTKEINPEFIKVISKIYQSRYFENLGAGFNFVINRNKFLAELDFTFSLLESKTILKGSGGPHRLYESRLQSSIEEKSPLIFTNNYILNNISKDFFLNQPDMVYEFRITQTHHPIQGEYIIPKNIELEKFNYEGLKQISDQSFQMSQWIEGATESKVISFINSKF